MMKIVTERVKGPLETMSIKECFLKNEKMVNPEKIQKMV